MPKAKPPANIGDKKNDLIWQCLRSFHQPINKAVVSKISANTPIAKGSKLLKKCVPENQFAEYPKSTMIADTAVIARHTTSAPMSNKRLLSLCVGRLIRDFRGARGLRLGG